MSLRRTFGVDELDALVQKYCISESSSESSTESSDDEDARIEKEFQARIDKLDKKAAEQTARIKACQERLKFYPPTPVQHIPEPSSQQLSQLSLDIRLHK
ncbi:MAG: hypothetical protein P1U36_10220 [Legionellaceae bacterium]|nr:hypothetical protein [Legionellaceae bacterium]